MIDHLPIPPWVHGYLRTAWENLNWLSRRKQPKKTDVANSIKAALGFVPGGVMVVNWRKDFEDPRDLEQFARWRELNGRKNPYLIRNSGQYNPFVEEQRDARDFAIAYTVYTHVRDGVPVTYSYDFAAKEHDVSVPTTRRAWATFKAAFPDLISK